jgi:HD-GYP domain-containing protein (c-di-GMP phosphodiesterase class II)
MDSSQIWQKGVVAPPLKVSLGEVLNALSTALDRVSPKLDAHQRRVCYIAMRIAEQLTLSDSDKEKLYSAALIHDIGAIALAERLELLDFESEEPHRHAKMGARLLARYSHFAALAPIVEYHHMPWSNGTGSRKVPFASHIIHLADRIEVRIQGAANILGEAEEIRQFARDNRGERFHPDCVDAFLSVSRPDCFWLDVLSPRLDGMLREMSPVGAYQLDMEQLVQLTRFFSLVIDSRSRFTATHSAGVAACAEMLARLLDADDLTARKMLVAGLLHDIGKLAVPNTLLEANRKLATVEFAAVRTHSYVTHDVLSCIRGLGDIVTWAANHHERLDGSGYPNGLAGDAICLPSRIMAVSDVFTALTESRPYRSGMETGKAMGLLFDMANAGKLDRRVVNLVATNLRQIDHCRQTAQKGAERNLSEFWQLAN